MLLVAFEELAAALYFIYHNCIQVAPTLPKCLTLESSLCFYATLKLGHIFVISLEKNILHIKCVHIYCTTDELKYSQPAASLGTSPQVSFFESPVSLTAETVEVLSVQFCNNKKCFNKMTCHFKYEPYCMNFPDNCSECIRRKHRPIIRACKWPTASTVSELQAEPESH